MLLVVFLIFLIVKLPELTKVDPVDQGTTIELLNDYNVQEV